MSVRQLVESKFRSGDKVWALTEASLLSGIVSSNQNGVPLHQTRIELQDSSSISIINERIFAFHPIDQQLFDDLTCLSVLEVPSLLQQLSVRYKRDQIYTWIGPTLVAINPYKNLDIYKQELALSFENENRSDPHIYAVASLARKCLLRDSQNASVIISGESGSGKTVSCNRVIQSLVVNTSSRHALGIKSRLVAANPILEAFGNAATLQNHNSSRYGKFHRIYLDQTGSVLSATIESYLLEKTRVVFQEKGERSYHIFYQMCHGLSEEKRETLGLMAPKDYNYLRTSAEIRGPNEMEKFRVLEKCFQVLGIDIDLQQTIWVLLVIILEIGNLEFQRTQNKTNVKDQKQLEKVASLLCIKEPESLETALTSKSFVSGSSRKSQYSLGLNIPQSNDIRDALAKHLYHKVFLWIINLLNFKLQAEDQHDIAHGWIGILDIFGFESFERNSFEQITINYANEKLKQQFNQNVFFHEQSEYQQEGLNLNDVKLSKDNAAVCDFFEKIPTGFFSLLDEECVLPKGCDQNFVFKLGEAWKNSTCFQMVKFAPKSFLIRHYAADVVYNAESFLDKNRDTLSPDCEILLRESRNQYIHTLTTGNFTTCEPSMSGNSFNKSQRGLKSSSTLGTQFKYQLNDLIATLNSTRPFYVNCIKPNRTQSPETLNFVEVFKQINYNGLVDFIAVRKIGWFFRAAFSKIIEIYRILLDEKQITDFKQGLVSSETVVRTLMNKHAIGPDGWRMGKTKLFLSKAQFNHLEQQADLVQKQLQEAENRRLEEALEKERVRLREQLEALKIKQALEKEKKKLASAKASGDSSQNIPVQETNGDSSQKGTITSNKAAPENNTPAPLTNTTSDNNTPTASNKAAPETNTPATSTNTTSDNNTPTASNKAAPENNTPTTPNKATPDNNSTTAAPKKTPENNTPATSNKATSETNITTATPKKIPPENNTPATPNKAIPNINNSGTPSKVTPEKNGTKPNEATRIAAPKVIPSRNTRTLSQASSDSDAPPTFPHSASNNSFQNDEGSSFNYSNSSLNSSSQGDLFGSDSGLPATPHRSEKPLPIAPPKPSNLSNFKMRRSTFQSSDDILAPRSQSSTEASAHKEPVGYQGSSSENTFLKGDRVVSPQANKIVQVGNAQRIHGSSEEIIEMNATKSNLEIPVNLQSEKAPEGLFASSLIRKHINDLEKALRDDNHSTAIQLLKNIAGESVKIGQNVTLHITSLPGYPKNVRVALEDLPIFTKSLVTETKTHLLSPNPEAVTGLIELCEKVKSVAQPLVDFSTQFTPLDNQRVKILKELLDTERTYVAALLYLYSAFVTPLSNMNEILHLDKHRILFPPSLAVIKQINTTLLTRLDERLKYYSPNTEIGDIFLEMAPYLKSYTDYVTNYDNSRNTFMELMDDKHKHNKGFTHFISDVTSKGPPKYSNFSSLMIQPVQRIPRYILLLEDVIKHTTESHPDFAHLQKALKLMRDVALHVNTNHTKTISRGKTNVSLVGGSKTFNLERVKQSYQDIKNNLDDFYYRIFQTSSDYGGIQIGSHTWMNITFHNCFTGRDFIDCVSSHYVLEEKEIKKVGTLLLRKKYISHLSTNLLPFTSSCFYEKTGVGEQRRAEITKRNVKIFPLKQ